MRFLLTLLCVLSTPVMADPASYRVTGAFVRATPAKISAGYMTLYNDTNHDNALVAVTVPWAERAELHTIKKNTDGVLSMVEIKSMPLPAHGTLELKNGGYHIMFFGVNKPLIDDTTENITLHFETGVNMTIPVLVKPITYQP